MTTEKHDPWALLREAQGWIGYWPLTKPEAGAEILKKRIDAALDKTRRDRRAQVLIEGQPHAGSASSRSATHA